MALFLTGGGEQESFRELDKLFLSMLPDGANILLIPLACEEDEYEDMQERIEEHFHTKKVHNIEMIVDAHGFTQEIFDASDAIIIEGGNTFKLIKEMRDSSFFNLIKDFYKSGKHIYADSAGAIILGRDVQTAFLGDDGDEDENRLQDYRGLDIIHPWSVHAHSTPDDYEDLNDLLYDKGNPIMALSEPTGVFINNGEVQVFGEEQLELITFAGRSTLPVRQKSTLDKLQGS